MGATRKKRFSSPHLPHPPCVHGGRGLALLGFAGISSLMAMAYLLGEYLGPIAVWPPVSSGVYALELLGGMRFWGSLWAVAAILLVRAAFRRRQTVAMSVFAFMVSVWSISYALAFIREITSVGSSPLWLSSAIFAAFMVVCAGLARMLNTPPLDTEAILRRLKQLEADCPPGAIGGRSE